MSQKCLLLTLVISILFVNIFGQKDDEYYCRKDSQYQICRHCIDQDNCNVAGEGCFCDNIAIYKDSDEDFVGGANCNENFLSDGEPFCYVSGESNCEDIVYSNFANSYKNEIDDKWYPKGGIHVSKEACYNENRKINGRLINETGNEEYLEGIKIISDNLVSPRGDKIYFTFDEPEYKDGTDYSDYDYDEEPGYIRCQKQCSARNIESNMCGAWTYDALNGNCYLHNVDACCGQWDKQEKDPGFISGYACPHCWSTRKSHSDSEWCGTESTHCDLRLRQTCRTCTIHNSGAAESLDLSSPAGLLRVDVTILNIDVCQCIRKYRPRRKKWSCQLPCCKEGGCEDPKRCRKCRS